MFLLRTFAMRAEWGVSGNVATFTDDAQSWLTQEIRDLLPNNPQQFSQASLRAQT